MDEDLKDGITLLLERRWIVRAQSPEEYQLIRRQEKWLKEYFRDKCGWLLIQNPRFYKLEKVPAVPERWMGIRAFQDTADYVLLCCCMAYLEELDAQEQFLLSSLCGELLSLYPGNELRRLRWEDYHWRRSLVRTLNFLLECGILRLVEDDSEGFLQDQSGEALYETTVLARYFLRAYPKDLHRYTSLEELCRAGNEAADEAADTGRIRRNRVYRQLLLAPCCMASEAHPEDFAYLRNMYRRLRDEMEARTGMQLELYKDIALLTSPERSCWCRELFPYRLSGLHAVVLHFSHAYRRIENWREKKQLSCVEFERFLEMLRAACGDGWTKELREMSAARLREAVLEEMLDWGMADYDAPLQLVTLRPLLFRLSGRYPEEYQEKGDGKVDDRK